MSQQPRWTGVSPGKNQALEEFMKIDSRQMGSHIYGACSTCLDKAMVLPENRQKSRFGQAQWVRGECDICFKITAVAPVKNYEFPVFEVKGRRVVS